jgi:two-component system response regulator FixJ
MIAAAAVHRARASTCRSVAAGLAEGPGRAALIALAEELERDAAALEAPAPEACAQPALGSLTARQREILGRMALGLRTKQIAFELGIDSRTVETHRSALLRRIGARNGMEAVRIAVQAGLGPLRRPSGEPGAS